MTNDIATLEVLVLFIIFSVVAFCRLRLSRVCAYDPSLFQPLPENVNSAAEAERFLRDRDLAAAAPLRPSCHSEVQWHGKARKATDLVVLHLHGWSASPLEIDPVDSRLASELKANLIRFRLSGHGVASSDGREMVRDATQRGLLRDAAEAFALSRLLGKRVVLIASSTGATLSLWIASRPWVGDDIAGVIALSPALRLRSLLYPPLKWLITLAPAAVSMRAIGLLLGCVRRLDAKRQPAKVDVEEWRRLWTTVYPAAALHGLVELYAHVELTVSPSQILAPLLALANPHDPLVDFEATKKFFGEARTVVLTPPSDEHQHSITGRVMAPSTVDTVIENAVKHLA